MAKIIPFFRERGDDRQYSISLSHRLINSAPLEHGDAPLVWNPATRRWHSGGLAFGEHMDSVPISDEEARAFMTAGTISDRVLRRLDLLPYDPD